MIVSNGLSGIRRKLQQSEFLIYTYLIFLSGFFLAPTNHLHRNFYYLFVIVPFLFGLDSKLVQNCIRSKLFQLSFLFLLYFWASMFWTDAHLSSEEYYDLSRYFLMLVIFIIATMMLSSASDKFFDHMKFWLCLVAFIAAISVILIFYTSHSFPQARLRGPFDYTHNPNQAAMHYGFVGIIAFYSFFSSKLKRCKIFFSSVLLTTVVYILLCQSRGPLLAIICSIILGLIFEKRWMAIGTVTIICVGFIFIVELVDIGIRSFIERGISYRIDLWFGALKRISLAPVLGEGYFTDANVMQISGYELSPHNVLLLVMVKSGIVGGSLISILIMTALAYSFNFFKVSGNWLYVNLFVYFAVCMTFDSAHLLYKPSLAWLIFWLPVGLIAGEEIRLKISATELSK